MAAGFTLIIQDAEHSNRKDPLTPTQINLTRLARQTGYSLSHLSRVFKGETKPSVTCLKVLAHRLEFSMEDLLNAIKEGTIKCLN